MPRTTYGRPTATSAKCHTLRPPYPGIHFTRQAAALKSGRKKAADILRRAEFVTIRFGRPGRFYGLHPTHPLPCLLQTNKGRGMQDGYMEAMKVDRSGRPAARHLQMTGRPRRGGAMTQGDINPTRESPCPVMCQCRSLGRNASPRFPIWAGDMYMFIGGAAVARRAGGSLWSFRTTQVRDSYKYWHLCLFLRSLHFVTPRSYPLS